MTAFGFPWWRRRYRPPIEIGLQNAGGPRSSRLGIRSVFLAMAFGGLVLCSLIVAAVIVRQRALNHQSQAMAEIEHVHGVYVNPGPFFDSPPSIIHFQESAIGPPRDRTIGTDALCSHAFLFQVPPTSDTSGLGGAAKSNPSRFCFAGRRAMGDRNNQVLRNIQDSAIVDLRLAFGHFGFRHYEGQ